MKLKILYLLTLFFVISSCSTNNQFSVTLLDEDNNEYQTISNLDFNEEIHLPKIEKDGHLFIGWSLNDNIYYRQFIVSENVSLTPIYEAYEDVFVYEMVDLTSNDIMINQYVGEAKHLYLPITIDGYDVTTLGSYAFEDTSITELYIHDFITSLKPRALLDAIYLENIYVSENNEYLLDEDGVLFASNGTLIQYPQGKTDLHYTVPNSTETIAPFSFMGQRFLESIDFPNSLTHIGYYAFSDTLHITSLTIPSSVEFIDAFITENSQIETIIIQRSHEIHGSITDINVHNPENMPDFYVPDDSLNHYQTGSDDWRLLYNHIFPQSELD